MAAVASGCEQHPRWCARAEPYRRSIRRARCSPQRRGRELPRGAVSTGHAAHCGLSRSDGTAAGARRHGVTQLKTSRFVINGELRDGDGRTFESINPADGSVAGVVYSATPQDVDDAVRGGATAAEKADWRDLSAHKRAVLLNRFADRIHKERDALVQLQTRDNGKTIKEGYLHVQGAVEKFRYCAAVCETLESSIMPPRGDYFVYKTYEPMGVIASMTAFNSPILHEAGKIAPALAAGNAVVLKSSEFTPLIGLQYGRLALEAGFPPGIVNVVTGGAEVGAALVNHPSINMIAFTGGTKTGRIIGHAAAERIIPCILELGGKSPNIVFADANLDHAVTGMIYGIFSNAGQSCIAGSRIFVQASIYDRFVPRLIE